MSQLKEDIFALSSLIRFLCTEIVFQVLGGKVVKLTAFSVGCDISIITDADALASRVLILTHVSQRTLLTQSQLRDCKKNKHTR